MGEELTGSSIEKSFARSINTRIKKDGTTMNGSFLRFYVHEGHRHHHRLVWAVSYTHLDVYKRQRGPQVRQLLVHRRT